MFRKKAVAKPAANLKSTERKKLLKQVCATFGFNEEKLSSDVKNKIMPKDLRCAKIKLHSGDNGLLYSEGEKPVWIEIRKTLVPTLFTLWEVPWLVPCLHTPKLTIERLQNGADLMAPGVFDPLPDAKKGSAVGIVTVQNPYVPVAVGIAQVDCTMIDDDMTGKAALTVNVIGDTVMEGYRMGYTVPSKLDFTVPVEATQEEEQGEQDREGESSTAETAATAENGAAQELVEQLSEPAQPTQENNEKKEEIAEQQEPQEQQHQEFSSQEVDNLFRQATVQAIRLAVDNPLDLPMQGSKFISQYVQPHLKHDVVMKKTSWKKATKYFKQMEKEGLMKTRERNGETVVVSLADMNNDQIKSHSIYKVKKQAPGAASIKPSKTKLIAKEFFKPRSAAVPLFMAMRQDCSYPLPGEVLRDVVNKYVIEKQLANGKLVRPDDTLKSALNSRNGTVTRDQLLPMLQQQCQTSHKIWNADEEEPKKTAKGGIPRLKIIVERRGGNKIVTILSNFEPFHLNATNISEELRVKCASATSVSPIIEGSDAMEILVQGPQAAQIIKILEDKGIKGLWVDVTDKVKNKKKR